MPGNWRPLFHGEIDGRPVKLMVYTSGELRVVTTQAETEMTDGSVEDGQTVMPVIISKGDRIEIDAQTPDELQKELIVCGFSEAGAKEIARLARLPGT